MGIDKDLCDILREPLIKNPCKSNPYKECQSKNCECSCNNHVEISNDNEFDLSKDSLAACRIKIQEFSDDLDKGINNGPGGIICQKPLPKGFDIGDYESDTEWFLKEGADSRMVGGSKYKEMKMEPWAEMEATESKEDFLTYLRIAAKKHQLRLGKKEGSNILEDMEKAEHIIQKWIEVYKKDAKC